ncbi:hypothetical protein V9T40_006926 [Parthenolecanium corni]|uniref:Uncharacterized protein n=1 Tax=Parthenolecanium corni TaxID=536013 RepID=A0AAN9TS96_9HEMI
MRRCTNFSGSSVRRQRNFTGGYRRYTRPFRPVQTAGLGCVTLWRSLDDSEARAPCSVLRAPCCGSARVTGQDDRLIGRCCESQHSTLHSHGGRRPLALDGTEPESRVTTSRGTTGTHTHPTPTPLTP